MNCIECRHPVFEQYEGYPGHWYCFSPQHFKDQREDRPGSSGNKICDTPVNGDEYEALRNAETPGFCPYLLDEKEKRYEEE